MPILNEKTVRFIVNFFYWHPVVQEYFMDLVYLHPEKVDDKSTTIENWGKGLRYISEHGDSMWAKMDYFVGKIRIALLFIAVIVMLALIVGWRP